MMVAAGAVHGRGAHGKGVRVHSFCQRTCSWCTKLRLAGGLIPAVHMQGVMASG